MPGDAPSPPRAAHLHRTGTGTVGADVDKRRKKRAHTYLGLLAGLERPGHGHSLKGRALVDGPRTKPKAASEAIEASKASTKAPGLALLTPPQVSTHKSRASSRSRSRSRTPPEESPGQPHEPVDVDPFPSYPSFNSHQGRLRVRNKPTESPPSSPVAASRSIGLGTEGPPLPLAVEERFAPAASESQSKAPSASRSRSSTATSRTVLEALGARPASDRHMRCMAVVPEPWESQSRASTSTHTRPRSAGRAGRAKARASRPRPKTK